MASPAGVGHRARRVIRSLSLCLVALAGFLASPVAAAVSAFAPPIVVVYPLTIPAGTNAAEAGADVSVVLATRLAEAGGITVKPYTQGTARAQYLDAADKLGADYYISGFLQPIGADVSMVVQLVSTHSGSVVYSTSTIVHNYAEAAAIADPLRIALLRHAGRGLPALDESPPPAEPTAAASNAPGVNLSRALRHRGRATAAPSAAPTSGAGLVPVAQLLQSPSPSPSPPVGEGTRTAVAVPVATATATATATTPPVRPVAVVRASPAPTPTPSPPPVAPSADAASTVALAPPPVRGRRSPTGNAYLVLDPPADTDAGIRTSLSDQLVAALRSAGVNAEHVPAPAPDAVRNATAVCAANAGAGGLYAPTIVLGHDENGGTAVQLAVTTYGCDGSMLGHKSVVASGKGRDATSSALARAADAIAALLAKP